MRGYQPTNNLMKDENGNLLDSQNIFEQVEEILVIEYTLGQKC
jgi:hypothetical protein